jgi:hypothetical protein
MTTDPREQVLRVAESRRKILDLGVKEAINSIKVVAAPRNLLEDPEAEVRALLETKTIDPRIAGAHQFMEVNIRAEEPTIVLVQVGRPPKVKEMVVAVQHLPEAPGSLKAQGHLVKHQGVIEKVASIPDHQEALMCL